MEREILYQVKGRQEKGAKHPFVAGAVVKKGMVVSAAPVLKYCVGRPAKWLEQYADLKKWTITKVPMLPSEQES